VLSGVGRALASDPSDTNRFYATLDFTNLCNGVPPINGVFTTGNMGATWTATATIPPSLPGTGTIAAGELNNADLSVSGSRVWSALLRNGVAHSIAYSDNQGTTWTVMDSVLTPNGIGGFDGLNPTEKPGGQGSIHFSFLASPTNPNEIYVGGDRQDFDRSTNNWPNFIGATDFTGRLFRGDASIAAANAALSPQWEHMTNLNNIAQIPNGGTASNSGPHADSRDLELRADGRLLEVNDGGITLRTNPSDNTGDWFGLCGNMQVFEAHNVAYEVSVVFILREGEQRQRAV
jgi:hypothetical protein